MILKVICIVLAITAIANASLFTKCDQEPQAISFHAENCNDQHCVVKRSTQAKMELTFKTTKEATDLKGAVYAQVGGKWIPWLIGSSSKVCNNLIRGKCPVAENSEATYGVSIKIPFFAPIGYKVIVQVRISDQDKNVVACTRVPVLVAR